MPLLSTPSPSELPQINTHLRYCSPTERIHWALKLGLKTMATTSMGPHAPATLHALSCVDKSIPIVWLDHGFHTQATHAVARTLREALAINLQIFKPVLSARRIETMFGGIPTPEQPRQHRQFTNMVKLEPFQRALRTLEPNVWISGIRREATAHRKTLDIVTIDARGVLKVAPFFDYDTQAMRSYLEQYGLPCHHAYFDPTKFQEGRECGLHLAS